MAPNELYYFVPGQVILHIEHDDMTIPILKQRLMHSLKVQSLLGLS